MGIGGVNQPALFDADRTTPVACPVGHCQAIRFPDQDKVPTCACDLERVTQGWVPRPAGCLNTYRPEHAEIPF